MAAINTAAAARSLAVPAFLSYSGCNLSTHISMAVLKASAAKTKPIANINMSHSMVLTLYMIASRITNNVITACIRALTCDFNKQAIPAKAYAKLFILRLKLSLCFICPIITKVMKTPQKSLNVSEWLMTNQQLPAFNHTGINKLQHI